jgi:NAD(P)-dependent dehydrogenase (short-subunit alcohol dehydrogenase family)
METVQGKVAVVTGAGSGIGRGIARALAAEGCNVVVADIDQESAERVAAELVEGGVEAFSSRLDVTERDAVEALADTAWERFGHVDICVNNAGVILGMEEAIAIDERDARWVLEVNLMGAWYGCSAYGRRFVAQGTDAHILNTGSEHSLGLPATGNAFYTASKHALLGLSDVLRYELPDFVGVSILCPGVTATNFANSAVHRQDRFGGPVEARHRSTRGLDPDDLGRRAVEGIKRGDFYIVTHPPVVRLVEEREHEILAAFEAQAPRYAGDEVLDIRNILPLGPVRKDLW